MQDNPQPQRRDAYSAYLSLWDQPFEAPQQMQQDNTQPHNRRDAYSAYLSLWDQPYPYGGEHEASSSTTEFIYSPEGSRELSVPDELIERVEQNATVGHLIEDTPPPQGDMQSTTGLPVPLGSHATAMLELIGAAKPLLEAVPFLFSSDAQEEWYSSISSRLTEQLEILWLSTWEGDEIPRDSVRAAMECWLKALADATVAFFFSELLNPTSPHHANLSLPLQPSITEDIGHGLTQYHGYNHVTAICNCCQTQTSNCWRCQHPECDNPTIAVCTTCYNNGHTRHLHSEEVHSLVTRLAITACGEHLHNWRHQYVTSVDECLQRLVLSDPPNVVLTREAWKCQWMQIMYSPALTVVAERVVEALVATFSPLYQRQPQQEQHQQVQAEPCSLPRDGDDEDVDGHGQCVVCLIEWGGRCKRVVFTNCGHAQVCIGCAQQLPERMCPVCRATGPWKRLFL
eukprot:TRINITY_DN53354_c0_g1_i1.p1 TRINITY_DN53354_c0_g1~~TRINITY_DN53354_c0_g1_i1.p1  ORF type:complete len:483 (-),score=41.13 TRINITY_DN53354_c0_g1_i1:926-2293(-)